MIVVYREGTVTIAGMWTTDVQNAWNWAVSEGREPVVKNGILDQDIHHEIDAISLASSMMELWLGKRKGKDLFDLGPNPIHPATGQSKKCLSKNALCRKARWALPEHRRQPMPKLRTSILKGRP